ncbi:MAG: hypothetical protein LBD92_05035 [Oscillospiraceae bacterium]|jgi:hypothetical protein|nr:hypothetical protein [Oscillospiraceae bacterium]
MDFLYEQEIGAPDVIRASVVICPFSEDEIDDMDFGRFDRLIEVMERCGMAGRAKLLMQFLYGDDPEEPFENPEVCDFARGLFERCKHLYYFLLPHKTLNAAMFLCQAGADAVSVAEDGSMSSGAVLTSVMKEVAEATHTALKDYGFSSNDPVGAMVVLNDLGFLCID